MTVNQIVAWNIACFRNAAGMRQEEVGELIGRSKRNVSADERSWDGDRTREFNAQELAAFAAALGVPIGAFFLPPDDDGKTVIYQISPGGRKLGMGDLMAMLMPDAGGTTPVMEAYRHRILADVRRYLGSSWAEEWERWTTAMTGTEITAEHAADLREDRDALLRLAAKLTRALDDWAIRQEDGNEPR